MTATELARVAGTPQTALSAEQIAAFGEHIAPAPWVATGSALLWWQPPNRALVEVIDSRLGRIGPPLGVIGGLLRYADTPVGGYDEVLTSVIYATRRGVRTTTPFITVNSPATLVAGRTNWALPKVPGTFSGDLETGMTCSGDAWSLRIDASAADRGLPVRSGFWASQVWPDGLVRSSKLGMTARVRPAIARVKVDADPTLSGWFRSGRYPAILTHDFQGTLSPAA